jgi:hypothetical protein
MKSVVIAVASLFAVSAFAQAPAPAKKDEKKAAPAAAAAPAKKEEAKPAAPAAKKDEKKAEAKK